MRMPYFTGRRFFIRLAAFCLCSFLALGLLSASSLRSMHYYRTETAELRLRTLLQLSQYSSKLEPALQKAAMLSQPALFAQQLSAISHSASCAKLCLDSLPGDAKNYSALYQFFSQCESYVLSLQKRVTHENTISTEERAALMQLSDSANALCTTLCNTIQAVLDGQLRLEDLPASFSGKDRSVYFAQALQETKDVLLNLSLFENNNISAESISNRYIDSFALVTPQDAAQRAAHILGIDPVLLREEEEITQPVACYRFFYQDISVNITKQGGLLYQLFSGSFPRESILSVQEASANAKKYLEEQGFRAMQEAYYSLRNGICNLVFVYTKEDILYYSDSISIDVSLDSGTILNFDGSAFLQAHEERELPAVQFTKEMLFSRHPTQENITYRGLAVIEQDAMQFLCHELEYKDSNIHYLLYVNVQNGEETAITLLQ